MPSEKSDVTAKPDPSSSVVAILLEEYKSLRQEILSRSTAQAAILSLNMTAIAAVTALFSYIKDVRVFLLVPVISPILGAMYTDHAINIGKIGHFIRWQIKPRLAEACGLEQLVDYEVYVNNYIEQKLSRRHLLPLAIISTFVAVPALALLFPFVLPTGTSIGVTPEWHNVLIAAPGAILLVYFLLLYFPAHYGGRSESTEKPSGIVAVTRNDYK